MKLFLLLFVGTYTFASINFSILLFKILGKNDPRQEFSGNPGVFNVYRILGLRWASVVLLLDICRAMGVAFLWRAADEPETFTLNIFHIDDHHSQLAADDIDLEIGGSEVEFEYGGFPRVVAAIDSLRAANAGENNLVIHAGDAITGTLIMTQAIVNLFSQLGRRLGFRMSVNESAESWDPDEHPW